MEKKTTETKTSTTNRFIEDSKSDIYTKSFDSYRAEKVKAQTAILGPSSHADQNKLIKAAQTKDPLSLKSFDERGAAVDGKLIRMWNDPRYQALNPQDRVKFRAQIYKNYVLPTFQQAGLKPPDIKTWLKGTKHDSTIQPLNPGDRFENKTRSDLHATIESSVHAGQGITLFGAKIAQATFEASYGLAEHFVKGKGWDEANVIARKATDKSLVTKFVKSTEDAFHDTDFWLQTHPRSSMLGKASVWTGEQIVQLPLYEALGAVSGVGKVASNLAPGLTTKLAASKSGTFVARRLNDAFSGYVSNVVTSGDESTRGENIASGLGFAVFGGLLEGAGKWLKGLIKPEAMEGEYLPGPYKTIADSSIKKNTAEIIAQGGTPFARTVTENAYHSLTSEPRNLLTATNNMIERAKLDPTLTQLNMGEQMALQSISLRHYGLPLQELPHDMQLKVLARRQELIQEAAVELPAHVPDLVRAEHVSRLHAQLAENPELAKDVETLKNLFSIDVSAVTAKNEVNAVKEQTGIKNTQQAAKKASKSSKAVVSKNDEHITPKSFAQYKIDTVAHFRNSPGGKERLAADGTRIGGRDKRSWNERVKAENTKQFIDTLKEADGNKIKFENSYHRLLFHWANRKQIPTGISRKLLTELQKVEPNSKTADFDHQADRLNQHLLMLAQSGRLTSDKNVFKSTKVGSGKFTEWQMGLQTEIDEQELKFLQKTISQHPNGLKAMRGIIQIFQSNRRTNITNPQEWETQNKVIQNLLSGVVE